MMLTNLLPYWPDSSQVNECIRGMAESDNDIVLLAAHKQMSILRSSLGRDTTKPKKLKETDLLKAFLAETQDGFLLLPITGESGLGKSHMIRWLESHLRFLPACDEKYHIVRIPKGVSMREVLSRILKDIDGVEFVKLRSEIDNLMEEQDEDTVKQMLRAHILTQLIHFNKNLKDKRSRLHHLSNKEQLQLQLSSADLLQAYLSDNELSDIFMNDSGCISQLAISHMRGSKLDEIKTQFSIEDLKIDDIERIKSSSKRTQLAFDEFNNNNRWAEAVELLNLVIDKALNPLTNVGNKSAVDLFIDIRKALLNSGKELVLLIEDFAAMAGIQEVILDVAIRESDRGGEEAELCVMRTAVAMTSNYLTNRDTINTRAQYEYIVDFASINKDSSASDAFTELKDQVVDFCGRYMNAARYGMEQLSCRKDEIVKGQLVPFNAPSLSTECEDILNTFGKTRDGYHLFPLNEASIEELIKYYLFDGKSYKFNPRTVINKILRDILKEQRDSFFEGTFPTSALPESRFPVEMDKEIYNISKDDHKRLSLLLWFWGGAPHDLSDVNICKGVFDHLKLPFVGAGYSPEKHQDSVSYPPTHPEEPNPTSEPNPVPVDKNVEAYLLWKKKLDEWLKPRGILVTAQDANTIRKWILDSLKEQIDFSRTSTVSLRALKSQSTNFIILPNARGNTEKESEKIINILSIDELNDENPEKRHKFYDFIIAKVRFELLGAKSWSYDKGHIDYLNFTSFVFQLKIPFINSYQAWLSDQIENVVKVLFKNSLILGQVKNKNTGALIDGMMNSNKIIVLEEPNETQNWQTIKHYSLRNRSELQKVVMKIFGRYQGESGDICYGLDTDSIITYLDSDFKKTLEMSDITIFDHLTQNTQTLYLKKYQIEIRVKREFNMALKQKVTQLKGILNEYEKLVGTHTKQELIELINGVINRFIESGLKVQGRSNEQISKEVTTLNKLSIGECLTNFQPLTADEDVSKSDLIRAVSLINADILNAAISSLNIIYNYFMRVSERMSEADSAQDSVDNVEENINKTRDELINHTNLIIRNSEKFKVKF
jgi:hypothetical protein